MTTLNLYSETTKILSSYNKKISDILFISTITSEGTFEIPVDEFFELAQTIDYDNGYGGVEINEHLKIVGEDWWLERNDYDGAEYWTFKTMPGKPESKLNQALAYLILNKEDADHMGIRE